MRNYIIINGINSLTIPGLAIKILPPISKPMMRYMREEIDGRDGDINTELGYQAYDRPLEVGLFGDYDINQVIAFFNSQGKITFSDEPDKFYNFQILEKIDFTKLVKFRTATVNIHCQPFKYPVSEEPQEEEYEYVEGTGENITLNNTAEAILNKIEIQGNTSQQTYTGKNLFDLTTTAFSNQNVNITFDGTTIIMTTTTQTNSGNLFFMTKIPDELLTNGQTYTLSSENVSGVAQSLKLQLRTKTGGYVSGKDRLDSVTYDSTYSLYVDGNIYSQYNSDTIPTGTIAKIKNVQVEKGSTATSYEPYVGGIPSPNPNYPEPIHVVSGNNTIEITGRNLIDEAHKTNKWVNQNGAVVTSTGSNCIKIECQAGDKISTFATFATESATGIIVVAFYDENGNLLNRIVRVNRTELTITGTAPANTSYAYAGHHTDAPTQIQVQRGEPTEYEPFTSQSFPINLGDLEMASIPNTDYKDVFVKDGETWYKHATIGKALFDGTESWIFTTNGNAWYVSGWATPNNAKIPSDNSLKSKSLSNYFVNVARNELVGVANGIGIASSGAVNMKHQDYSSDGSQATDFKAWLGVHKPAIYYILNTPTDTEITNETLIDQLEAIKNAISYNGQTNISQTNNDLPFILDLSALKENSDHLVIDNIGNIYSKPTLDLEGTGIVDIYLNDTQMFEVDLSEKNEIVIDTEKMEAYNPTDNTLANRQVTGDYSKFKLDSGENDLRFSGNLTKATITNYERWL